MKKFLGILGLGAALMGSAGFEVSAAVASLDGASFYNPGESVPSPLPPVTGRFRNTFYYLVWESDYEGEKTETIVDPDGDIIAYVTPRFRKDLLMEGSGKLNDGRVVNYHSKIDGIRRFHVTEHPWGRGAGNCALAPFKSIAADPGFLSIGSTIYIDETAGMELPDGTLHNGIWYVQDTGGAIQKDRIDFFVGRKQDGKLLAKAGITHLQALTIREIAPPAADGCATQRPR